MESENYSKIYCRYITYYCRYIIYYCILCNNNIWAFRVLTNSARKSDVMLQFACKLVLRHLLKVHSPQVLSSVSCHLIGPQPDSESQQQRGSEGPKDDSPSVIYVISAPCSRSSTWLESWTSGSERLSAPLTSAGLNAILLPHGGGVRSHDGWTHLSVQRCDRKHWPAPTTPHFLFVLHPRWADLPTAALTHCDTGRLLTAITGYNRKYCSVIGC